MGDFGNEGKLIYDGKYLRDFQFTYDLIGHLPVSPASLAFVEQAADTHLFQPWLDMLAFPPGYYHSQFLRRNRFVELTTDFCRHRRILDDEPCLLRQPQCGSQPDSRNSCSLRREGPSLVTARQLPDQAFRLSVRPRSCFLGSLLTLNLRQRLLSAQGWYHHWRERRRRRFRTRRRRYRARGLERYRRRRNGRHDGARDDAHRSLLFDGADTVEDPEGQVSAGQALAAVGGRLLVRERRS